MKLLRVFAVLVVISIAGCSTKKAPSIEETISDANSTAKIGVQKVKENSSGFRALSKVSPEEFQKLAISPSGTMPSSSVKEIKTLQLKEKNDVSKMLDKYNNKAATSNYVATCSSFGDSNPSDPALVGTDYYTKPTAGIVQVANELGSIAKIFDFVKNEIENDRTYGAVQSADTLLRTRRGSVIDKANLLAALLRVNGTPVQFQNGEIYLTESQAQRFFNDAYIGNIFLTLYTIYGAYFTSELGFVSDFYQIINDVKYIVVPHVWLRVLDNGIWKNMDPTLISDPLLPNRANGLLSSKDRADFSIWFFGADENGDYIKPKTLVDFLLETAKPRTSIDFINAQGVSESVLTDGVVSNLEPCRMGVFNGVENSVFEFRGEVVVKKSDGTEALKINQPLARLSEDKSYLSHSAGLLSDLTGSQSGNVEFKIGDKVIAQFASNTGAGNDFSVILNIYFPFGFHNSKTSRVINKKHTAGGILVTDFFARAISQSDLEMATDILKKDLAGNSSSKIIMADVHRLAGLLFHFHYSKTLDDIYLLRGVRWLPIAGTATLTTQGRLSYSGNDNREFGFVPTMPVIDAGSDGPPVTVPTGVIGSEEANDQFTNASLEWLASMSDYEAKIWEELYGLKGYSAVRAFQIAALSDSINHSTYNYSFIKGVELTTANIASINSQIDTSSAFFSSWPEIQSIANPGLLLWTANKNITDPESNDVMTAWFLIGGNVVNNNVTGARFSVLSYGSATVQNLLRPTESRLVGQLGNGNDESDKKEKVDSSVLDRLLHPFGGGGSTTEQQEINTSQGETLAVGPGTSGSVGGVYSCNPVDFSTGQMWHHFTDLNLRGHTSSTGLFFQRTYYTLPQYQTTGGWEDIGDLGKGWMHNFDTRLLDGSKDSSGNLLMGALPNSNSNVLWITDKGNTILFSYNSGTGTFSAPSGFNGKLEVSGSNYVLTQQGNIKYYFKKDYSSNYNGRLLKIKDPHGEELTLTYDGNGRLSTVTSPFAGDLNFTRDSNNKLIRIKSTKNNLVVNFGFTNGKLTSSTDFDGNQTTYQYNTAQVGTKAEGLLTSFVDPLNRKISFEYYQNGRVYREVGLGNAVQTYQYAPYLYQKYTRVGAPNGQTTEYRYDNNFRAVLEVRPDGARIQRKWNSDGREQWETDGLGNKTEFTYDSRGNRTGIKRPLYSTYVTSTYDQTYDVPVTVTPIVSGPTQITLN